MNYLIIWLRKLINYWLKRELVYIFICPLYMYFFFSNTDERDLQLNLGKGSTCIFVVCLGFYVQLENFSLIWRRHHYRWHASNFDLCLVLMAIEYWGFCSVPHLLWHRISLYKGHLQGVVTFISAVEHLAVELSLPVSTT